MVQRKNLRHRSLGFESLEQREMLSVSPLSSDDLSSVAFFSFAEISAASSVLFPPPTVKATTATSITLEWNANLFTNLRPSDPFTVERKTLGANNQEIWTQIGNDIQYNPLNSSGVYTYEITGLTISTEYELRVTFGSTVFGKGLTESITASTLDGELKAEAKSSTAIQLSWSIAARNSTYYQVERLVDGNWIDTGQRLKADTNPAKSFTLTELENGIALTPGTEYTFRLQYNDPDNNVKYSQLATVRTLFTLEQVASTVDSVNLAWDAAMIGSGFVVQICPGTLNPSVEANWSPATTTAISATEHQVTGLKTNTSYYFRVKYTAGSETLYTDVLNFSTSTSVKVGEVTADSVALSWSFTGRSGIPYYVQISDVGGDNPDNWRDVPGGNTMNQSYTIRNLEPGQTYHVRVRYIGIDGREATTAAEKIVTGTETKLVGVTENSATIGWTAIGTNFNVQRCDGTLDPKADASWTTIETNVTGGTYTNNHLASNKQYYYRVEYTDADGELRHTMYVSAVTSATLKVGESSIDTVQLRWDFVPNNIIVQMFRGSNIPGESGWTTATIRMDADNRGCTVLGLIPDNHYFFRIQYTTETESTQRTSTVASKRTEIGNFIVTERTAGSLELRWARSAFTNLPAGRDFVIRQASSSGLPGHSDWNVIATISSAESSCTVNNLLADTRYRFQIGYMEGSTFQVLATLDADTVRTLPNRVEIDNVDKNSARLTWSFLTDKDTTLNDNQDGDGQGKYALQQFVPERVPTEADRTSTGGDWVTINDQILRDNKFYILDGLETGSTQYYRIVYTYRTGDAVQGPGAQWTVPLVTKYSEIITVTTRSDIRSGGGTNSAGVSWDAAPNLKSGSQYTLQQRIKGESEWASVGSTASLQLVASNLAANTEYEFRVVYTDTGDVQRSTAVLSFKTEAYQISVTSKELRLDSAAATVEMQYAVGVEQNFTLYFRPKAEDGTPWMLTESNVPGTPSPSEKIVRFDLPNLLPEIEYEFKVVYELTESGAQRESEVKIVTITDELMPSNVTPSSAVIAWSLSGFADKAQGASFFVEWRIADSTDSWTASPELAHNATGYSVTGLNGNTEYEFRIRYATAANATAYSTLKSVTTLEPPMTVTTPQFGSVKVEWNFPASTGGYIIEYKASDGNWYAARTVANTAVREATFSVLETGPSGATNISVRAETEYVFRIRYKTKADGDFVYSVEQTITTLYGIRAADNSVTSTAVTIEWDYTTLEGSTYTLRYHEKGTGSATWQVLSSTLSSSTRSYTVANLEPGIEYEFELTYYDSMERKSLLTVATPARAPIAPSGLTIADVKSAGATLRWTDNSENEYQADGYVIEYTNTMTGAANKVVIGGSLGIGPMSFELSGLDPNTNYSVKVYARNAEGESTTVSTTFRTSDIKRPNAVQTLRAATTTTTIALTWTVRSITDFPDPTKFRIEYYDPGTKLWYEIETVTIPTTTATKTYDIGGSFTYGAGTMVALESRTTYQFRVVAISEPINTSEVYGESPTVTVNATPPLPTAPSSVSARDIAISAANIQFADADKLIPPSTKTYTIEIVEGRVANWATVTAPQVVAVTNTISNTVQATNVGGLKPGTVYSYIVKSVYTANGIDVEAVTKIMTFTTAKLPTASGGRSGFTMTSGYDFAVALSWTPPAAKTVGDVPMTFNIYVSESGKAGTFVPITSTSAVLTPSGKQYASTILFSDILSVLNPPDITKFSTFSFQIETVFGTDVGSSLSGTFRMALPKFVNYV